MRTYIITRLLSLACAFIISVNSYSSIDIISQKINSGDGLPNNSVRAFLQDSKGFLWMATLNGLSRYDGNSFVNFFPDNADDKVSLADYQLNYLKEDKNGLLWIGTSSRMFSCYDLQKGVFVDFTGVKEHKQKYSRIFFPSDSTVWLWDNTNGCRHVKYKDGKFTSKVFKKELGSLPHDNVRLVCEDSDGNIWISTRAGLGIIHDSVVEIKRKDIWINNYLIVDGEIYFVSYSNILYKYDKKNDRILEIVQFDDSNAYPTGAFELNGEIVLMTSENCKVYNPQNNTISSSDKLFGKNIKYGHLIKDNGGDIWIYNKTGNVFFIEPAFNRISELTLMDKEQIEFIDYERYDIKEDPNGIKWISTYGNGLFSYNPVTRELSGFKANNNKSSCINSNFLLTLSHDRSGAIWVSCEFAGINKLSVIEDNIKRIFPEDASLTDRSNTIRMIKPRSNGEIWVSTRKGGLYIYDNELNLTLSNKRSSKNLYDICTDTLGHLWIGTRGEGVNINGKSYFSRKNIPGSISSNNVFTIKKDLKGRMWVGTFGGGLNLARKDGDQYKFSVFFNDFRTQKNVRVLYCDTDGDMWMGCDNGIYRFNPDSLIADRSAYIHYSYDNGILPSNEIRTIVSDNNDNIWVGTSGGGLCRYVDNTHFDVFTTKSGLANNIIQGIVADHLGNLWISTELGISKFIISESIFENYIFSGGILENSFSENSACLNSDGNIIFGTNNGVIIIDPETMKRRDFHTPIIFTNLKINGVDVYPDEKKSPLSKSISYSDSITLDFKQNSFVIEFNSLNYKESDLIKYSYKLDNYDTKWTDPSKLNFASYKYIDPGNYTLRVKASDSNGIWRNDETVMHITVLPPFYMTTTAFAIYIILLIISLFAAYKITINFTRLRNRIAVEKELTEYKLIFFTNISHEFRTPLTLIIGALDKIKQNDYVRKELAHPLKTLDKSANRMMRLIDQLLEFRKMQNNKLALSLEETDVIGFVKEIFYSFNDIADSKNMTYVFSPSVDRLNGYIDKGKVDKIVYNLLSNAFKYTQEKGYIELSIELCNDNRYFDIRVSDNGIGISNDKKPDLFKRFAGNKLSGKNSVGVGLHLSHELVTIHKGNIRFFDNSPKGSVFEVTLPYTKELYSENDFATFSNDNNDDANCIDSTNANGDDSMLMDILTTLQAKAPMNKYKILIIEDDNDVRNFLKTEISAYFEVISADNGEVGLQKAIEEEPDLIISDIMMPVMDGYEVCRKIKNNYALCHIPVILLTALGSQEDRIKGYEFSADAYITKPFSLHLLLARIVQLIEKRLVLREKFGKEIRTDVVNIYSEEKDFMDKLNLLLDDDNMIMQNFTIEEFSDKMGMSRNVLYKKTKAITGFSPVEYIRIIRMKKAASMLISTNLTVAEISYKVGINDPFYFSKCFKAQYGKAPSVYQKENRE